MPAISSPLDATIRIVTPENIAFEYRLAGPGRRLLAYLIDLTIQTVVVVSAFIALMVVVGGFLPGLAAGAFLIGLFLVQWF